jgi:hypothetical protein
LAANATGDVPGEQAQGKPALPGEQRRHPPHGLVIAELRPGELRAAADAHWTMADPANRDADRLWWNWCRMPAAISVNGREPESVAAIPGSCRI